MKRLIPAIAAATLLSLTAAHGQSAELSSVYTELLKGRCQFTKVSADGDKQTKRCPGVAGAKVYTHVSHTRVYFAIQWPSEKEYRTYAAGWSLGDKVEWLGTGSGSSFRPRAFIVRLIADDPDTGKGGGHVLAVLRAGKGQTCVAALVDVKANPEPNILARKAAGSTALNHPCGRLPPVVIGVETPATARIASMLPHDTE